MKKTPNLQFDRRQNWQVSTKIRKQCVYSNEHPERASRRDTFIVDFDLVWHSMTTVRPSKFLGVAPPHSLPSTHTHTHTHERDTMYRLSGTAADGQPLLLLPLPASCVFLSPFFPFLAFVCRPSMLFVWCHPYYFVAARPHSIYRPDTVGKR